MSLKQNPPSPPGSTTLEVAQAGHTEHDHKHLCLAALTPVPQEGLDEHGSCLLAPEYAKFIYKLLPITGMEKSANVTYR